MNETPQQIPNQQPTEPQPQPEQQVPVEPEQPVTTPQQPPARWLFLVLALVVALAAYAGVAYWQGVWPFSEEVMIEGSPTPTPTPLDLNKIFDLSNKEPGTKIYYSESLGVGFTYFSDLNNYPTSDLTKLIYESGNKIEFSGPSVEVFTKDPELTLKQAIEDRFLKSYDPKNCFVVTQEPWSSYQRAEIHYPAPTDPKAPFWQNADKCPRDYSLTNTGQFFVMDENVPDKFMFLIISDPGAPSGGDPSGGTWIQALKILK